MRVLLDTHTYLWWLADPDRLSLDARYCLRDRGTEVWVSVASYWEIAIKCSLGKLKLSREIEPLATELALDGMSLLQIVPAHCAVVQDLPFHHRDPFDRMLIGQALSEGFTLVSCDQKFDRYPVNRIW